MGSASDDTILGWTGDDQIVGLDGDDMIFGEQGSNTYIGGRGSDLFVVAGDKANTSEFDVIKDFSIDDGDAIDLSSAINREKVNDEDFVLSNFVRTLDVGYSIEIQVSRDGLKDGFYTIIILNFNNRLTPSIGDIGNMLIERHILIS
ncbi:hypothetical protein Sa4125_35050 [Aureimonas sp. SA4125]|uniref:type I secretion C-terminal target domain-containing protein n=1 Tax=Aureimonas sp. SA4125 TaxID=2826993 RepID=UPI001CC6DF15|nr:type I secretion C-terminal target domain-containing protein [Aureimonas sp. SA4125]BDA85963.1 hypothetical protein Sa4125_35050 [Aureimonas sp. SA4125]